jgi:formyl-CoA transferase
VEVSMMESSMSYNRANYALRQAEKDPLFKGPQIPRAASTLPGVAPYNIYKTTDVDKENYIAIVCKTEKQWTALLRVIGREDLIGNPKFRNPNVRWENVAEVDKTIEDWTKTRSAFECFHKLCQAGVPAGVTQNSTQFMNDPHFLQRETIMTLDHPHRGPYKTVGSVYRLSNNPIQYQTAPLLGQSNLEVYAKYLGLTFIDCAKLAAEGVI